jgi:hypothetical protein
MQPLFVEVNKQHTIDMLICYQQGVEVTSRLINGKGTHESTACRYILTSKIKRNNQVFHPNMLNCHVKQFST